MELKAKKEKELSLHKAFYKATHTLTLIYPPSKNFQAVFSEDMLLKNNKCAFQQVVYYLLNIIEPDKVKQYEITLPFDTRTEKQFYTSITQLVKEINATHTNAEIPSLLMSQFVFPSGIKCINFLLKLSQFALFKYLQSKPLAGSKVLLRIKPSSNIEIASETLKSMEQVTSHLYNKCDQTITDFNNHLAKCREQASIILSQQSQNTNIFKENELLLKMLNDKFSEQQFIELTKTLNISEKLENLQIISAKVKKYNDVLSSYLSSKSSELVYDKDIPTVLEQSNQEDLNLIALFEKFNKILDRQRLEVKPLGDQELTEQIERFQKLNQRLTAAYESIVTSSQEFTKLSEDYEDGMIDFSDNSKNDKELTPLAIPFSE